MTPSTITTGIRISPQLWAEFNLWAKKNGKTRNHALVDLIRGVVIREPLRQGGQVWGHKHLLLSDVNPDARVGGAQGGREVTEEQARHLMGYIKAQAAMAQAPTVYNRELYDQAFIDVMTADTTTHSAKEDDA